MAGLIPPTPVGALPGSSFWNDWIEKVRTVINSILVDGFSWNNITGKPTTLAGYGITDAVHNNAPVVVTGQTTGTGGATPTLTANKPGSNAGVSTWLTVNINGTSYYIPLWT